MVTVSLTMVRSLPIRNSPARSATCVNAPISRKRLAAKLELDYRRHMEHADALFEEYKTVRQESLEAAGRMQSVTQYLFAAMGVVVTVAIVAAEKDRTVGAAVVMSLIPITVVVGMAMTTLELQRVLGARKYSRQLEIRINAHVKFAEDPGSRGSGNDSQRSFAR